MRAGGAPERQIATKYDEEKKVNVEFFPLLLAADKDDVELAGALLENGADANRPRHARYGYMDSCRSGERR